MSSAHVRSLTHARYTTYSIGQCPETTSLGRFGLRRWLNRCHPIAEQRTPATDPAAPIEAGEILVQHDLEARGIALRSDDRRPREEKVPDAKPALAIGRQYRRLVADPVIVPALDRDAVVNADVLDGMRLPPGLLHCGEHRGRRQARVGAWEDVLVHEQCPDEVLRAKAATEARPLKAK